MAIEFTPIAINQIENGWYLAAVRVDEKIIKIVSDFKRLKKGEVYKGKIKYEVDKNIYFVEDICEVNERDDKYSFFYRLNLDEDSIKKIITKYQDPKKVIVERPWVLLNYGSNLNDLLEIKEIEVDKEKILGIYIYNFLIEAADEGETFVYFDELINFIQIKLKDNTEKIEKILKDMYVKEDIFLDDNNGKKIIYLYYIHQAEKELAKNISKLIQKNTDSTDEIDKKINDFINKFERKYFELKKSQKKAVKVALKNKISIINGMPGTGKTTIVKAIVEGLKDIYRFEKIEIVSLAGKAVERVSNATGIQGKTIHRFLGLDENGEKIKKKVDVEVLIIDEASMIDLELFNKLLSVCINNNNFRLIILGDPNQLKPIGVGQVFEDLVNSNLIPTVTLTEIVRQEMNNSIIANSRKILLGKGFNEGKDSIKIDKNFKIREIEKNNIIKIIIKEIENCLKEGFRMNQIQVLAPFREGKYGTKNINKSIVEFLRTGYEHYEFYVNDRVIQNENNYKKQVFNGEMGIIEKVEYFRNQIEKVYVKFNDSIVEYSGNEINQIELAFATTVHKYQGSESDIVIFVLADGINNKIINRNLIYVATTRAKESVIIIGNKENFNNAIQNKLKLRNSKLGERIKNCLDTKNEV